MNGHVDFTVFRGTLATWDQLFSQAAAFAGGLEPGALIGISHSADRGEGVVTVWHRVQGPPPGPSTGTTDY